ncbi:hypothetical protein MAR_008137, partial [Mya arenaria]
MFMGKTFVDFEDFSISDVGKWRCEEVTFEAFHHKGTCLTASIRRQHKCLIHQPRAPQTEVRQHSKALLPVRDTTASNQNEQSTPQRFPNGQANFQNGQPNFPNGQPNFQNGQRQANFPNGQAQTNFPNGQANFPQGFPNGQQPQFPMGFPPQRFPNGRQPFFPPGVPSRQPLPFPDRTQRSGQSEMAFGGPFPGGPFPFPPGGPGFQQTGFEDFRAQQSADLGPEFSTTSDQQQQNDISLNFQPLDQ